MTVRGHVIVTVDGFPAADKAVDRAADKARLRSAGASAVGTNRQNHRYGVTPCRTHMTCPT